MKGFKDIILRRDWTEKLKCEISVAGRLRHKIFVFFIFVPGGTLLCYVIGLRV